MKRRSSLQHEIGQRRPFASVAQEGVLGLLRTADVVRRRLSSAVEPRGLTLQQYNVLRILRGAGPSGLPTLDIAARMIEQAPGITRLLDRIEAKGLVQRQRCARDRRRVLCSITGSGLAILARLDLVVASMDRAALGGLRPAQTLRLVGLLDAVRAGRVSPQSSSTGKEKEKRS